MGRPSKLLFSQASLKARGPAGGQAGELLARLMELWNARIGGQRGGVSVRERTAARARAAWALCAEFGGEARVIAVMQWYGRKAWNRDHAAWMRFDDFLTSERFVRQVEEMETAGRAAEAGRPVAPGVAQICAATGQAMSPAARLDRLWAELGEAGRAIYIERARAEDAAILAAGARTRPRTEAQIAGRGRALWEGELEARHG